MSTSTGTPRLYSVTTAEKGGTMSGATQRSRTTLKPVPNAIVVKNRDTKVTVIEFNPDPAAPHLNATMTEPYLGLELSYRK